MDGKLQAEALFRQARGLEQQCIEDRRHLHAHAETGFDLAQTCNYVRKRLTEIGFDVRECGRAGLTCALGRPGRTILLRADMDALPLREETGLPFACADGRMHACGHDMHAAMLICAARLLKMHEAALPGTVKLMFQPAEETLEGARDMIDAGVLENPRVNAALMLHVLTAQTIPVGTIIISAPGVSAPAAGTFSLRIFGKGSHGAMPHTGVDPISAAAHTVIALQEISARELAMNESAALTIGSIQAGEAANVIPDTAVLHGNYRGWEDETIDRIRSRTAEISQGVARVFRARSEIQFHASCPTLINDAGLAELAEACLPDLLGRDRVYGAAQLAGSSAARSSGSEDFASVSHAVPSLMLALAAGRPEDGYTHPLHHPGADFDERALVAGAAAYAWFAMRWLEENA